MSKQKKILIVGLGLLGGSYAMGLSKKGWQVQAIDRMVDEDVPCEDVLAQINAAKSALHRVGQVVLAGHIQHCVRDGIQNGDADKTIESFTQAGERFAKMG